MVQDRLGVHNKSWQVKSIWLPALCTVCLLVMDLPVSKFLHPLQPLSPIFHNGMLTPSFLILSGGFT